jgi:hypothetical protein
MGGQLDHNAAMVIGMHRKWLRADPIGCLEIISNVWMIGTEDRGRACAGEIGSVIYPTVNDWACPWRYQPEDRHPRP